MQIAIVGSGVSGLLCAHLLFRQHDVTVFEVNDHIGGHVNTVAVDTDDGPLAVDTGFIVFNRTNYPHFSGLLDSIGVSSTATEMSFSVRCQRSGHEYSGSSLNGLFAQRRNLLSASHYRMILDILRFHREAAELSAECDHSTTIREFLERNRFGRRFTDNYFLPMGAAIWSCPTTAFEEFPVRFIIEFFDNHGLLQIRNRPTWRTVDGGSSRYVEKLTDPFRDRIRLKAAVSAVTRHPDHVMLTAAGSEPQAFDEVILACHADQALDIVQDLDPVETDVLSAFPYGDNTAVLHTDTSLLPVRRRAWASWNYLLQAGDSIRPSVTYNMNILQRLRSKQTFCVTLNDSARISPEHVIREFRYSHPVFSVQKHRAQARHLELIRHRRTSYCGAYWGNGFHEAGVASAMAVCDAFQDDVNKSSES